jgi:hypothetical protein
MWFGKKKGIIAVDRSVKPNYMITVEELMSPDLENTGPAEYELAKIRLWRHEGQTGTRSIRGTEVYEQLQKDGLLQHCLGFRDAEEIKIALGVKAFEEQFRWNYLMLWRSVVRSHKGLLVPRLSTGCVGLTITWRRIDEQLNHLNPTPLFPA